MKVTADTITDEQIRELDRKYWREKLPGGSGSGSIGDLCILALSVSHLESRRAARARCAEIWNARHATEQTK